jgi:hypothetical protein
MTPKNNDTREVYSMSIGSSFYTLNDRVILPISIFVIPATIQVGLKPIFIALFVLIYEIVLKYLLKLTNKELLFVIKRFFFSDKNKKIKN